MQLLCLIHSHRTPRAATILYVRALWRHVFPCVRRVWKVSSNFWFAALPALNMQVFGTDRKIKKRSFREKYLCVCSYEVQILRTRQKHGWKVNTSGHCLRLTVLVWGTNNHVYDKKKRRSYIENILWPLRNVSLKESRDLVKMFPIEAPQRSFDHTHYDTAIFATPRIPFLERCLKLDC